MGTETRKRTKQIKIRVSPEEKKLLEEGAGRCDLSVPAWLRKLGLGHRPASHVDIQALEKIARRHSDLGRVGGLLKMWLSDSRGAGQARHLDIPDLVTQLLSYRIQDPKRLAPHLSCRKPRLPCC